MLTWWFWLVVLNRTVLLHFYTRFTPFCVPEFALGVVLEHGIGTAEHLVGLGLGGSFIYTMFQLWNRVKALCGAGFAGVQSLLFQLSRIQHFLK